MHPLLESLGTMLRAGPSSFPYVATFSSCGFWQSAALAYSWLILLLTAALIAVECDKKKGPRNGSPNITLFCLNRTTV